MSLQSSYTAFLANPAESMLSGAAVSLNYITTLTTLRDSSSIVQHLLKEAKQLKKKEEKVLSAVESDNAVCMEVQTTLEFIAGGAAYLPGLDDNFLTDRVVTFPIVHFVHFDAEGKIQQIRLHWDQASLLKQVDVIGSRAKAWPVYDGKDQARLIASSVGASASVVSMGATAAKKVESRTPKDAEEITITNRGAAVSRVSGKPPPRDLRELLGGDDSDNSPAPPIPSKGHSFAGGRSSLTMPKTTVVSETKGFQPNRLFENDTPESGPSPPAARTRQYKSDPKKFQHFELDDRDETPQAQKGAASTRHGSKHGSQWSFEDFVTPQKVSAKVRGQDVRHFGWSDDDEEATLESPGKNPRVAHPRRDADTHFELQDDSTPQAEKRPPSRPRGAAHNTGLGLYENHVIDNAEDNKEGAKGLPLGNVTNVNAHRKYFDSHFSIADDSPVASNKAEEKPLGVDRKTAVKKLGANWETFDRSPEQSKKENFVGHMASHGDGAGGRKGLNRTWGIGDDSEGEGEGAGVFTASSRKQQQFQRGTGSTLWDF